ncbi:nitrate regulatory gene2 protein-like [Senna tora]|uniref:Nitrate regulatory gene2 protein-like n=1 Tax=Senna tora TaxID=362788 RepID=A0A834XB20_9FABA|nr:nitrate regulatory gene2 protein-like [Senna tora]
MGCVASKLEEEEEVVAICKERKSKLKLAVERRYALAEAHCKYFHSLYAVAAAIQLFVARHSSPSTPFLITFPPPCPSSPSETKNVINNPMFLQQAPSESKHEAIACDVCAATTTSTTTSESSSEEEEREEKGREREDEVKKREEEEEPSFGYFYMHMPMPMASPPSMPSPQRDFGWDFFNPFEGVMRAEVISSGYRQISEDDFRVVREEEGIPELEEEGGERDDDDDFEPKVVTLEVNNEGGGGGVIENVVSSSSNVETVNVLNVATTTTTESENQEELKGLKVLDTQEEGRELLDALKDIEDHFLRAYDSGKDVTRMLEANRIQLQSGLKEIKGGCCQNLESLDLNPLRTAYSVNFSLREFDSSDLNAENSIKLIHAIAWNRSTSKPSSCKSLVVSDTKNSATWTEYKNELFDDYGGMDSGSHSLTLGRLYAWEKKLYEEVKAGDSTRKNYEKKCTQLRNKDVRGDDVLSMDKTRAQVKDLYAGILVAIRRAESISKRIQKIRDEELQPQIVELLKGLTQTWKIMLETHETQKRILSEVRSFTCPTYGKFCNESHRLATLQLETQLRNWNACFRDYTAAQKAYVEALHGWLSKFIVPEVEFYSQTKNIPAAAVPYHRAGGPPLLVICHDWLASLRKLPDKTVTLALKSVTKDMRALWLQQGEEQQQKRKVESLSKDLDRRHCGLDKAKSKMLELKVTLTEEEETEHDHHQEDEYMMEKKDQLEALRRKVETEKEKHHSCMQETQRITLHGLQSGFSLVFESLTEFSKASQKMYNDLVMYSENAEKSGGGVSCIEDCSVGNYNSQT